MSYKHKRSAVAGKVPIASDFKDGEILVNTADGRAFINTPNGVKELRNNTDNEARFLRFDAAQTLAASAAGQARANIGADMLAGFRNKVINGDFDIWQRATSQTTVGYRSADRWSVGKSGASVGSFTVSRIPFGFGQSSVPGNPRFHLRIKGTGLTFSQLWLSHRIEDVRTFSGKTVTLTFWARASKTKPLMANLAQNFGTGGSPSPVVNNRTSAPFMLSTAFQKFTWVTTLPSIEGRMQGLDGNSFLDVGFDLKVGAIGEDLGDDHIDIAHVSLVEGDASTEYDPFSVRHQQQELALCQRYYRTFANLWVYPIGDNGNLRRASIPLSPPMRGSPTVTYSVEVAGSSVVTHQGLQHLSPTSVTIEMTMAAVTDMVRATNIALDAEL